ncbi:hypothetical protein [Polyangium sp. y55x31]|uniref:hypothetical protein n=1 Tax=Polyangium sp. y55x31 TaxID=3042688 RepID=UPI002482F6FA|nr:hypothetical protein [Polyangium sp. y55x31]MDI1476859.1 hypothetical protein [Polyangium sp. y55x31]
MGIDLSLFIERRSGGQWVNPTELCALFPREPPTGRADIEICWWPLRWPQTDLFFGPNCVFLMEREIPSDLSPEVSRVVRPNFENDTTYAGWIMVEDLFLDLWETEMVLVEHVVPERLVDAFGSGEREAGQIRRSLEGMGLQRRDVDSILGRACLAGRAQDWQVVRHHELHGLSPDHLIPVTWRQSIAEFAGRAIWEDGLKRLRDLPSLNTYRVVTGLG